MPIHKVTMPDGSVGYQWGRSGKKYKNLADARKQERAIYASGWREPEDSQEKSSNQHTLSKERNTMTFAEWSKKQEKEASMGKQAGPWDYLRTGDLNDVPSITPNELREIADAYKNLEGKNRRTFSGSRLGNAAIGAAGLTALLHGVAKKNRITGTLGGALGGAALGASMGYDAGSLTDPEPGVVSSAGISGSGIGAGVGAIGGGTLGYLLSRRKKQEKEASMGKQAGPWDYPRTRDYDDAYMFAPKEFKEIVDTFRAGSDIEANNRRTLSRARIGTAAIGAAGLAALLHGAAKKNRITGTLGGTLSGAALGANLGYDTGHLINGDDITFSTGGVTGSGIGAGVGAIGGGTLGYLLSRRKKQEKEASMGKQSGTAPVASNSAASVQLPKAITPVASGRPAPTSVAPSKAAPAPQTYLKEPDLGGTRTVLPGDTGWKYWKDLGGNKHMPYNKWLTAFKAANPGMDVNKLKPGTVVGLGEGVE